MLRPLYESLKDIPYIDSASESEMTECSVRALDSGETSISIVRLPSDRVRHVTSPTTTTITVNAKTACFRLFSLVYALAVVATCLVFVIAEIITDNVPLYFFEVFFTYVYGVSVLFLLYVFVYVLHESSSKVGRKRQGVGCCAEKSSADENLNDGLSPAKLSREGKPFKTKTSENDHSHGGFFLRIGAIAFGLGTMVYNGLELGMFFEIPQDSQCWQILMAVNPCLQALFTFMQMYFIFMNSRLNIHKFKCLARFGLMHLIATNVCVWIRTVVRESLRVYTDHNQANGKQLTQDFLVLGGDTTGGVGALYSCNRTNIVSDIVRDASPYLFPLIIEYSLIAAAVLFVMWNSTGRCPRYLEEDDIPDHVSVTSRKVHTKVDCIGSSMGLFCGLLVLVAAVISLVLYFVLIGRPEHQHVAIFLADSSHAGILLLMIIAVLVGCCRNPKLKFSFDKPDVLDAILLRISAFGLFVYSVFCVLSAALSSLLEVPNLLVLVSAGLAILEVFMQLLYLADVSKRCVSQPEHDLSKPGRQVVTFMLLCNLALWAVYTLEIDKVKVNPVQLNFYGALHWAVIQRVTLPLAIFHRFYSSVMLAEVWKSSYKARAD